MTRRDLVALLKDWGLATAITVAVLLVLRAFGVFGGAPVTGGEAPPLAARTLDGAVFRLDQVESDVVVVNFWATWCAPCRQEIPEFSAFAAAHPDVTVLGISVDRELTPAQLAVAAKRLGISYTVLHDPTLAAASAWGVSVYPTTFVLDAHRHIVAARVGVMNREGLERAVADALAARQ